MFRTKTPAYRGAGQPVAQQPDPWSFLTSLFRTPTPQYRTAETQQLVKAAKGTEPPRETPREPQQ